MTDGASPVYQFRVLAVHVLPRKHQPVLGKTLSHGAGMPGSYTVELYTTAWSVIPRHGCKYPPGAHLLADMRGPTDHFTLKLLSFETMGKAPNLWKFWSSLHPSAPSTTSSKKHPLAPGLSPQQLWCFLSQCLYHMSLHEHHSLCSPS